MKEGELQELDSHKFFRPSASLGFSTGLSRI